MSARFLGFISLQRVNRTHRPAFFLITDLSLLNRRSKGQLVEIIRALHSDPDLKYVASVSIYRVDGFACMLTAIILLRRVSNASLVRFNRDVFLCGVLLLKDVNQ